MFASRNATVEAGKAWAARPSVPAAPAAPALLELPQPAATTASEHERSAHGEQLPEAGKTSKGHVRTL